MWGALHSSFAPAAAQTHLAHTPLPNKTTKVSLEDALRGTSFDAARRAVFLAEGLTYYLPPEAVKALFASVAALAAPGSRFAFDWLRRGCLAGRELNLGYETMAVRV